MVIETVSCDVSRYTIIHSTGKGRVKWHYYVLVEAAIPHELEVENVKNSMDVQALLKAKTLFCFTAVKEKCPC